MSFALKKKTTPFGRDDLKSKIAQPMTKNFLFESNAKQSTYSSQKYGGPSSADPIMSRFEMIETNLNRVINQHEALLPLINSQPDLQSLAKHEFALNIFKAKLQEDEKTFKTLESDLQNFQQNIEGSFAKIATLRNEKPIEIQNLEKGMKGTNNLINSLQSNLKDVESTVLNFQRLSDSKFKDLSQSIITKVDTRTQRNQEDVKKIISEFENYIKNTLKNKIEILNDIFPHPVQKHIFLFKAFLVDK